MFSLICGNGIFSHSYGNMIDGCGRSTKDVNLHVKKKNLLGKWIDLCLLFVAECGATDFYPAYRTFVFQRDQLINHVKHWRFSNHVWAACVKWEIDFQRRKKGDVCLHYSTLLRNKAQPRTKINKIYTRQVLSRKTCQYSFSHFPSHP